MSKEPAKAEYKITLVAKKKPLNNIPDEDQMFFTPTGRLYVIYDEGSDDEPYDLHDVTDNFIFRVEKI